MGNDQSLVLAESSMALAWLERNSGREICPGRDPFCGKRGVPSEAVWPAQGRPCPWQGMPKIRIREGPFLAAFQQPDLLTPLSALDHIDLLLEGTYESRCLHECFPSLVFLDSKSTLGTDGSGHPGLANLSLRGSSSD